MNEILSLWHSRVVLRFFKDSENELFKNLERSSVKLKIRKSHLMFNETSSVDSLESRCFNKDWYINQYRLSRIKIFRLSIPFLLLPKKYIYFESSNTLSGCFRVGLLADMSFFMFYDSQFHNFSLVCLYIYSFNIFYYFILFR